MRRCAQGTDTLTVRLPAGAYDLLQWNDVLSRLPLGDGFERTLTLFDLDIQSGRSMGLGDDGQRFSRGYVPGAPVYVTAAVRVTGRETLETEGGRVAAYRVEVLFHGRTAYCRRTGATRRCSACCIEASIDLAAV